MLRVARKRLQNKKRKAMPKKPRPPAEWADYPAKATVIEFFWAWLNADCDPAFTPDGKPWLDQDQGFWKLVWYLKELFDWAMHRAENPVMQIRASDQTMADI